MAGFLSFMVGCACLGFCMIGLMFVFSKYVFAGLSILTGDKQSLNEFGNICDERIPYRDAVWSAREKWKPGDPPLRPNPKPPWEK